MKLRIASFDKEQAGFTLIELMCAIVITGFISLGISMSISQVLTQTSKDTDYTMANRNAMNAIYWISRDAMMAQSINITGFPSTANLRLNWITWDNTNCSVNYTIQNGQLWRIFYDGINLNQSLIADNISSDPAKTYCSTNNNTLTFTITSSVGEGNRVVDVQRERQIVLRSKL